MNPHPLHMMILVAVVALGCNASPRIDQPISTDEEQRRLQVVQKLFDQSVQSADRIEYTMVYFSDQARRVGPCVTSDSSILSLLKTTSDDLESIENNPFANVHTMPDTFIEMHLVNTNDKTSFRVRILGDEWMALGHDERYRIHIKNPALVRRIKEIAEKEPFLPWIVD